MEIMLASSSPRRQALLEQIGLRFSICADATPEIDGADIPPEELVIRNARKKTEYAATMHKGPALFIGADTIVRLDGTTLGKPKDRGEASRMLGALSGRAHMVYTGVYILSRDGDRTAVFARAERASVHFRDLSDAEIAAYVATGEPMDKAGAYGAQGLGAVFVRRVEGDYNTVVGLPLAVLYDGLKELGVRIEEFWDS